MSAAPRPARPVGGIPIGRIGSIRLVVSWTWLLSVAVIVLLAAPVVAQAVPGTGGGAAAAIAALLGVLLGASVLVHELGHCLAARSLGVPVTEVRLYLLGGVSELGRAPATPREEAVIAAAGPGLSVVLTGVFFLLVGGSTPHTVGWLLLIELALANGIVAVFNLLPALPLDGGRVLRAGVWQWSGRRRWGTAAAAVGGYAVAVALAVWALVQFTDSARGSVLQGGIAAVLAVFVALGAAGEHQADRPVSWPAGRTLAKLARPVVQLPAEIGAAMALQAAGNRAVVLVGPDGVVAGLLDEPAAIRLLRTDPGVPALSVSTPIWPESVVVAGDDPAEVAARARPSGIRAFLLVGEDGLPAGVVAADELTRILTGADRPAPGGR